MEINKSTDPQAKPSVVMLVYGFGGVGKSTFTSTAPTPLLLDFENGAKYFGLRGIDMDVARIGKWEDLKDVFDVARSGKYKTIVIDPIGEMMEKLRTYMVNKNDKKLVQSDGSPSMAGWGWLKDTMRSTIKIIRDSGVHLILVAHVDEKEDEGRIIKRPKIMTKLSEELVAMVDIVGYMTVVQKEGEEKRVIVVDAASDTYVAKDRTGQLGKAIPPNFDEIIDACQGNKKFSWSAPDAKDAPKTDAPEAPAKESTAEKLAKAGAKGDVKAQIAALEKEIESDQAAYDVAEKHPTDTAQFRKALAKQGKELAQKRSKLATLKGSV